MQTKLGKIQFVTGVAYKSWGLWSMTVHCRCKTLTTPSFSFSICFQQAELNCSVRFRQLHTPLLWLRQNKCIAIFAGSTCKQKHRNSGFKWPKNILINGNENSLVMRRYLIWGRALHHTSLS